MGDVRILVALDENLLIRNALWVNLVKLPVE